jgi:hypothetical protein
LTNLTESTLLVWEVDDVPGYPLGRQQWDRRCQGRNRLVPTGSDWFRHFPTGFSQEWLRKCLIQSEDAGTSRLWPWQRRSHCCPPSCVPQRTSSTTQTSKVDSVRFFKGHRVFWLWIDWFRQVPTGSDRCRRFSTDTLANPQFLIKSYWRNA